MNSNERADTFATYLEKIQWAVRPATLVNVERLYPALHMNLADITLKELREAAFTLKGGKASGPDDHPVEYWKAVLNKSGENSEEASAWL